MEVFMVLINDEDDDATVQEEEDLPNPTPTNHQALVPRAPSVWYRRLVPAYRHSLTFTNLNRSYKRTFHLYVHPIYLEHFSLEESASLQKWRLAGIHQELVQREYFWATEVDLGYWKSIDVNAVRTQLRKNRNKITLDPTTGTESMEIYQAVFTKQIFIDQPRPSLEKTHSQAW
ncbi:41984_t:CDS:2 [Gigaspora margarita]|uniref:41984_t:CDS:1 n=1 Tax=Gigaspora margarita TaxID=4874 RepID=A0ABM8VZN6_GIGMA|nr:41984_t:CDS:2 [Gigaspora margarita]